MYSMKPKSVAFILITVCFFSLICLQGCKEPDIKLVNKVKSFEPKWATLSEKMSYLDRNLKQAEKRFEKDFAELEGMLGVIESSKKGKRYRGMLKDYDTLVVHLDTLRIMLEEDKDNRNSAVTEFNDWEKKVMGADIGTEAGLEELIVFKMTQSQLENRTDSLTGVLDGLFTEHNLILKNLSEMMEIYANYDIRMQ